MRKKLFFLFLMAAIVPLAAQGNFASDVFKTAGGDVRITFIGHGIAAVPIQRPADLCRPRRPARRFRQTAQGRADPGHPSARRPFRCRGDRISAPGRDRDFRQPFLPAAAGGGSCPEERRPRPILRRGHRDACGLQYRPAEARRPAIPPARRRERLRAHFFRPARLRGRRHGEHPGDEGTDAISPSPSCR